MKKGLQTLSNHVKQGDMVKIISGKDKGKIGEKRGMIFCLCVFFTGLVSELNFVRIT